MPTFFIEVNGLDNETEEYLQFVNNNLKKKDVVKNPFTDDSGIYRLGVIPPRNVVWMVRIYPVYPHLWAIGALSLLITIAAHLILFPMPTWLYILDAGLIIISGVFYLSPIYMLALYVGARVQTGKYGIIRVY